MKLAAALMLALLPGGCGLPRDPERTLERVHAERRMRVGIVARGDDPRGAAEEAAFLARLARTAGARAATEHAAAEALLARLEAGELDLVVGRFADESPWETRVTLTEPIATWPAVDGRHRLAAAVRNGENAWLMLVDRVARGDAR